MAGGRVITVKLIRGPVEIEYAGRATATGEVLDLGWHPMPLGTPDDFSPYEATIIEGACGRDLVARQAEWRRRARRGPERDDG